MRRAVTAVCCLLLPLLGCAHAASGPLGIDHRLHYDNHGIWKRSTQIKVEYGTALTVLGGSLLQGDQDKLGDTFWRSLDAVACSSASAQEL
jgi:undecaprenyl-diphosphatase